MARRPGWDSIGGEGWELVRRPRKIVEVLPWRTAAVVAFANQAVVGVGYNDVVLQR
jgi:hypothetical protein